MRNETYRRLTSLILAVAFGVTASLAASSGSAFATGTPANDNIANAIVLNPSAGTKTVTASNVDATLETGEATLTDGEWVAWRNSIWYAITPPSGFVEFNTIGSDFDTMLAVFTFDNAAGFVNPTLLALNDELYRRSQSAVSFIANGTTTYYIGVGSWNSFAGNVVLNWKYPTAGNNDSIANAIALVPTSDVMTDQNNFNSNVEANESNLFINAGYAETWANSVWYKVQPTARTWGIRLANLIGAQIAVLDGSNFSSAQIVKFGHNALGFEANGTSTYYIAISSVGIEQSFDIYFDPIEMPSVVRNVNLSLGSTTTVTWSPPVNFDEDIHSYRVELIKGDTVRTCLPDTSTSCSFPRLGNGTWTLEIVARDAMYNFDGVYHVDASVVANNLSNDYFSAATSLNTDTGQLDDYFDRTSLETNEPTNQSTSNNSSLWYVYTPSTSGTTTFSVATKNADSSGELSPAVAAFSGTSLSNLQSVANASNTITWNSTAGQRYYVRVTALLDYSEYGWSIPDLYHSMTWSHVAAPAPVVEAPVNTPSTPKITTVKVKNNATLASILKKAKIKPPKNSKVTYKIDSASKKLCSISSSKMKFKKKGSCSLTVKIKPKKGAAVSHLLAVTN